MIEIWCPWQLHESTHVRVDIYEMWTAESNCAGEGRRSAARLAAQLLPPDAFLLQCRTLGLRRETLCFSWERLKLQIQKQIVSPI